MHFSFQKYLIALSESLLKKSSHSELFWSAFFSHFPAFGLNTERYSVSLRIQSECGKMREKCGPEQIPNTDTFYAVNHVKLCASLFLLASNHHDRFYKHNFLQRFEANIPRYNGTVLLSCEIFPTSICSWSRFCFIFRSNSS